FLFTATGGRVPVADLLAVLGRGGLRDRAKVLLLDPARFPGDPTLGLLHNDFARALADLEAQVEAVPKLVVVRGSGPGGRAWDSDEWGSGASPRSLLDGLGGRAAPAPEGKITAWDLFAFARQRTEEWTRDNRPTAQVPMMLPAPDRGGRA